MFDDISLQQLPKTSWLEYFVVLVEERQRQQAAERLGISVQALHQGLGKLSSCLQAELFSWQGSQVILTPQGQHFLPIAYRLLQKLNNLAHLLADTSTCRTTLYLGYTALWRYLKLTPQLLRFQRTENICLALEQLRPMELEQRLLTGSLDLGFSFRVPLKGALTAIQLPIKVPLVIIGRPQPPKVWHELKYIAIRDLQLERQLFKTWNDGRYRPDTCAETDSAVQALHLCRLGLGAVIVPGVLAQDWLESGQLVCIAEPPDPTALSPYLIYNPEYRMNSACEALLNTFCSQAGALK